MPMRGWRDALLHLIHIRVFPRKEVAMQFKGFAVGTLALAMLAPALHAQVSDTAAAAQSTVIRVDAKSQARPSPTSGSRPSALAAPSSHCARATAPISTP